MEVNFNRTTIISFPDNSDLPDIETGIAEGSLLIDEVLFTDRFTVGTYNSNRFECELYDFPLIGNEKIYVYQVVDEVEGQQPINVPLFTGYVESCTTNRGRFEDSKKIVAYDVLYSKGTLDVAEWWEDVFDDTPRVTVKTLRDSLCTYAEITCDDVTLPNDDVLITQTQQLDSISFQSMLKYILEINGVNANVGRDGVLHFITISNNSPIALDTTYAQNTSEFDVHEVPAYTSVVIVNSTEGIVGGLGGKENRLQITDNLLLLDKTAIQLRAIAENIFNAIRYITYLPAQIDMIYSNLSVTIGDRVKIGNKIYLVCENIYSGPQLVDQHICSTGRREIEESSTTYNATQKDMQTKIQGSSMKYYRFVNKRAMEIGDDRTYPIINIRHTSANEGVIIFHGCVIIDVELVDSTQPGTVEIQYVLNNTPTREYTPTETYHADGRHTLNLLHFWEATANNIDYFTVKLTTNNLKVAIGAFKIEAYMEGMGLAGEATWDGIIDVTDDISSVDFRTSVAEIDSFGEDANVDLQNVIRIEVEDSVDEVDLDTMPKPSPYQSIIYINKEPIRQLLWRDVGEYTWQEILDNYVW